MELEYQPGDKRVLTDIAKRLLTNGLNPKPGTPAAPTKVTPYVSPLSKTQGPYVPGLSDNPATAGTSSGNYTKNKTFVPVQGYTGPLNKTQGPYVPGMPANPDYTQNKTFFPSADGKGYYRADGSVQYPDTGGGGDGGSGSGYAPSGGGGGYSAPAVGGSAAAAIAQAEGLSIADLMGAGPQLTRPTMRSGKSMADHLGMVYDRDEYARVINDAIAKQYANLDADYDYNQGLYYNNTNNMARMLGKTLQTGDQDAVRAGASEGTQAATRLAALLGISEQTSLGASELAALRGKLVSEREAAIATGNKDALKWYNDTGVQLGTLANSELGHGAVMHSGDMASLWGAYTGLQGIASNERINANQLAAEAEIANANNAVQAQIAAANAAASRSYGSGYSGYSSGGSSSPVADELSAMDAATINYAKITSLREAQANYKQSSAEWKYLEEQINSLMGIKYPTKEVKTNTKTQTPIKPATAGKWTDLINTDKSGGSGYIQMKDR